MSTFDVHTCDPIQAARYASTLWELHWASFCYREASIFPKNQPGPQTALAVRTWGEAEILMNAAFPGRKPGGMSSMGGRYLSDPEAEGSLQLISPWDPGSQSTLVRATHTLELTLCPDRSNLRELAFQLHREFNFVADILGEKYAAYLKGSRMMANQWRNLPGWAEIPGYREALGPIGRETSPPSKDF
jgi:hypothetical protein